MHCYTGKAVIYFYRKPMRWHQLAQFIHIYETSTAFDLMPINPN